MLFSIIQARRYLFTRIRRNKYQFYHLISAYNALMQLESLQLFVEVMRHGNFADVARAHDMAPSSVSRSIAALERELGARLFQRSTRKLTPTEAAAVFYHRLQPALREIESARVAASDLQREISGTLRVSAPAVFTNSAIVPLLPEFSRLYPQLRLDLQISDRYVDLLEDGIDAAIRLGSLADSSLVARRLADMTFRICASPDYLQRHGEPRIPADITDHECLLFPRTGHDLDWLFRDAGGQIERIGIDGRIQIANSASILACAIAGLGLALLPDWLLRDPLADGRLQPLFADYEVSATDFDSAVWILYPSRSYLPQKTRVFVDFLAQHYPTGSA